MRRFAFLLSGLLLMPGCSSGESGPNGTVKIELFRDQAPITVKNFLDYVAKKHYDGTIFHRVIPNFMVQGGGFVPGLKEKGAVSPIENESDNGLRNERGTLAMARTPDPNSATDQFFINLKYNDFLDRAKARDGVGYAVFGKVIDGMDVVDRIAAVKTADRGPHEKVPVQDVSIKSIRLTETAQAGNPVVLMEISTK